MPRDASAPLTRISGGPLPARSNAIWVPSFDVTCVDVEAVGCSLFVAGFIAAPSFLSALQPARPAMARQPSSTELILMHRKAARAMPARWCDAETLRRPGERPGTVRTIGTAVSRTVSRATRMPSAWPRTVRREVGDDRAPDVHAGDVRKAVLRAGFRPGQGARRFRLDERLVPRRIVEHGGAHVDDRIHAVRPREQPALAAATVKVLVGAMQAA